MQASAALMQVSAFIDERQVDGDKAIMPSSRHSLLVNIAQSPTLFWFGRLISCSQRNDLPPGALAHCNGWIDRNRLPGPSYFPRVGPLSRNIRTSRRCTHRCYMMNAQLLAELAQSCRLLASHQQNQNVLDMLHDLEEDFAQEARDIERRNLQVDGRLEQSPDGHRFPRSPGYRY